MPHTYSWNRSSTSSGPHILEDDPLRGFPSDRLDALRLAVDDPKRDGILAVKESRQDDGSTTPEACSSNECAARPVPLDQKEEARGGRESQFD